MAFAEKTPEVPEDELLLGRAASSSAGRWRMMGEGEAKVYKLLPSVVEKLGDGLEVW